MLQCIGIYYLMFEYLQSIFRIGSVDEIMHQTKLVALDLDGTLFNNESIISQRNKTAIQKATASGIHVVISTGRPFCGIPFSQIEGTGIRYALTANGSAIYEISTGKCLYEACLPNEVTFPILDFLLSKEVHMDAFIEGKGYSPQKCLPTGLKLPIPPSIKEYVINTRTRVEDLKAYMQEHHLKMQKMTINFIRDEKGELKHRKEVYEFLSSNPAISCVSGGYNNLEYTRSDVNKGTGLTQLAKLLDIPVGETMAIGDTENDIAIIRAAGIGVAMGNATPAVKEIADCITLSNEEDGVACMLEKLLLSE